MPNMIIPGLWVGDAFDSLHFPGGAVLCVLETHTSHCNQREIRIPIITEYAPTKPEIRASHTQLDKAAKEIHRWLQGGFPILVHCAAGIERSPLTVAWYLWKYRGLSWEDAYTLVQHKRSQTQRRDIWIQP